MLLSDSHLRSDPIWVRHLLKWYDSNKRDFPWRRKISTYHTWICEVMSQQTTMAVVVPRFSTFIETLPNVNDLAQAPDELLRELWAGLGYYARARNLRAGARFIVSELKGRFPESYEDWLNVPGVGPYTASVISSICYSVPKACVDGNVMRVVSRLTACSSAQLWNEEGRIAVQALVDNSIARDRPGDFNQAMMELGATLCQKRSPGCDECPVRQYCLAKSNAIVELCPPNKPRKEFVPVYLLAFEVFSSESLNTKSQVLLIEREQGFLSGTVGFPILRCESASSQKQIHRNLSSLPEIGEVIFKDESINHTITNHKIQLSVVRINLKPNLSESNSQNGSAEKILKSIQVSTSSIHWVSKSHAQKRLASSLDRKIWEKFS